ncbi:MAG TPA: hypothetical protein VNO21_08000 [Polyangiaceae bacterium]|nr:hypothetical protein [Polyangiaceae bacterium]
MAKEKLQAKPARVRSSGPSRAPNRRGSPEAIEKRRAARMFNDILGGRGLSTQKLDGRTEKRRQRLLQELEHGTARGARELKPLDILQRVEQLLALGEPLSSIRKVSKLRKFPAFPEGVVDIVERLHKAYGFRPETYRFVGIGEEVLREAGVLGTASGGRSPHGTASGARSPSTASGVRPPAGTESKPRRARKTASK